MTNSFSHLLPNLFIGLCKGNRALRPHSTEFRDALRYGIFRLEASFRLTAGARSNPDLVMTSNSLGNTLVLEWSESGLTDHKKGQLERYAAIRASDLSSVLAVPVAATHSHDIVLILKQSAVQQFKDYLEEKGWAFPILVFDSHNPGCTLQKLQHDFSTAATNTFFDEKLAFERIPMGYLPFSLEEIANSTLVTPVVSQLTSMIVRDESTVRLRQFCSGYVPAWDLIAPTKQQEIARNTKELLNDLSRHETGRSFIRREQNDPPTWLLHQNAEFRKKLKSYRGFLNRFIARKRGEEDQLQLFPD